MLLCAEIPVFRLVESRFWAGIVAEPEVFLDLEEPEKWKFFPTAAEFSTVVPFADD
jgi:hypothetical protein